MHTLTLSGRNNDNYSCGDDGPARSAAAIYDKVAAVTTPYPD
jgi:hypothetical protein